MHPFPLLSGGDSTSSSAIGPLGINGQFFTSAGLPLTLIQSSDFSLFQRFLDLDPLVPDVLAQRQAIGFNTLRVWLLNQSVVGYRNGGAPDAGIVPASRVDFYERLTEFNSLCSDFGLVVEYTVFTQTLTLMPKVSDQQKHLDRTADALRGAGNVLIELVNEWDQHDNACSLGLRRPSSVLISRGSNGADKVPPMHSSPWDYELYHTNDLPEWQRKTGHNAMEWADESGKPCTSNENTRYPDRDQNEAHAYDAAAGGALLCAGSCYHSQAGKFSTLFTGIELTCAEAWVAGARSVPLEFQRGKYIHRKDLEGPGIIRVYERRLSDGRSHIVSIRQ